MGNNNKNKQRQHRDWPNTPPPKAVESPVAPVVVECQPAIVVSNLELATPGIVVEMLPHAPEPPNTQPVIEPEFVPLNHVAAPNEAANVEWYRRCPICWGERGGYGIATSTQGKIRYYKCLKSTKAEWGGCSHTWKRTISPAEVVDVTHRQIDLSE